MTLDDTHAAIKQNSATPKHSSHKSRSADASIATPFHATTRPGNAHGSFIEGGQTTKQRHSPSQSPSLVGLSALHAIHTSRPRPRAGPVPRLRMARVYWALCLTCSRWGKVWIGKRSDSAVLALMGRFFCWRRLLAHVCVLALSAAAVVVGGAKCALLSGMELLWSPRLPRWGGGFFHP